MSTSSPLQPIPFDGAPALVVRGTKLLWLSADGEIDTPNPAQVRDWAGRDIPLVCHMPSVAAALDPQRTKNRGSGATLPTRDVLELFAFTRPAQLVLPTVAGVAELLGLPKPDTLEQQAMSLTHITQRLLSELALMRGNSDVQSIAFQMARAGWAWGPAVLATVDLGGGNTNGFEVWHRLEEWEDIPPEPLLQEHAVSAEAAEDQLKTLRPVGAEERPQQVSYTRGLATGFQPRRAVGMPQTILAEAGTGVGKTLGYIAPASLWARETGGTVWVSTYTKNLQRQVDQELAQLYPDPAIRQRKVVVRKGRENYLCLLNFEHFVRGGSFDTRRTIMAGLLARWVRHTRDGDMIGGDLPGWLAAHIDPGPEGSLTDRRGECIYSACPHYKKCFIERAVRKSRRAEFVVANHALVMIQAAMMTDPLTLPLRYVFDEGHHIFEAADSAFSARLSGAEGRELRRWLLGSEIRRSQNSRGLAARAEELCAGNDDAKEALYNIQRAAQRLPDEGWRQRLIDDAPHGPIETFLVHVRNIVRARVPDPDSFYDLEAMTGNIPEDAISAAQEAALAIKKLKKPMGDLKQAMDERLDNEADTLDTQTRVRLDATARSLERRQDLLSGWEQMLFALDKTEEETDTIDWFNITRYEGRDVDVGLHRHYIDPTRPFAHAVLQRSHGAVITSATLRDRLSTDESWSTAERRTGVQHLPEPAQRVSVSSPFDYAKQTEVLIVTDVKREDVAAVSAAFRELFKASNGSALGLFTAISRLRQVYGHLLDPLAEADIPLYAQHIDPIDNSSLVDIFKGDVRSCLLGTDALRDGVDVPGEALRLIVFDRVPWPRRTLLHTARKKKLGGDAYDDMLIRLKLKQAFGRLIRRADDYGVFVMLDSRTPTRLLEAFPSDVTVKRVGLADAIATVRNFMALKASEAKNSAPF